MKSLKVADRPLRVFDLCCGAGGMSAGFKEAGFELVGAMDISEPALRVYNANLGDHAIEADLTDILNVVPSIIARRAEILLAGAPCQDFSTAGKGAEGANAAVTKAIAMIICLVRPKWFVLENVIELLSSEAWAEASDMFKSAGYGLSISKVNAAYYGVPQNRKRVIIVGRLGEGDAFLEGAITNAASEQPMTVRDMLGDTFEDYFYMHPYRGDKRSVYSKDEQSGTVRTSSRRSVPARYHREAAALLETGAYFTGPNLDEPAPERPRPVYLKSPNPRDPVHPSQAIVLTQEHTSAFQGFPSDWDWSPGGSLRNIDQLIANAVPPPLAKRIALEVLARERGETIPEVEENFLGWLRKALRMPERTVRKISADLSRIRWLLNGRLFADAAAEMRTLESSAEFLLLPPYTRTDLRYALRLHNEWRAQPHTSAGRWVCHRVSQSWGSLRSFFRRMGTRMGFRASQLKPREDQGCRLAAAQPIWHEPRTNHLARIAEKVRPSERDELRSGVRQEREVGSKPINEHESRDAETQVRIDLPRPVRMLLLSAVREQSESPKHMKPPVRPWHRAIGVCG